MQHATGRRPRRAALAVVVPLAVGLTVSTSPWSAAAPLAAPSVTGAAAALPVHDVSSGVDLRSGAVFSMSNSESGNRVTVFDRVGGRLQRVGSYPTGGRGSGGFEDSDNGMILGSATGESAPNNLISATRLLFVTNSGSDTITVFRVLRDRLERIEVQDSGGHKPISVTVNRGRVYVLNSGETVDGLPTPPNCTTGRKPTVTGFRVTEAGRLTPIPGSTRQLSGDPFSGCAQVSFTPDGRHLVATERLAVTPGETPDDEGRITTFAVRADGTLGRRRIIDATGQGPFGFTFTKAGVLITTEQFDGPDGPGRGAAANYLVNRDGTLTRTSRSVPNGGTDTCWVVVTDDGKYAFATSFFGGGRISSYRVGRDGSLRLLNGRAADRTVSQTASDLSLSGDSEYLYQLNSAEGTISEFKVTDSGGLRFVQKVQAHPANATTAEVIGLAAS